MKKTIFLITIMLFLSINIVYAKAGVSTQTASGAGTIPNATQMQESKTNGGNVILADSTDYGFFHVGFRNDSFVGYDENGNWDAKRFFNYLYELNKYMDNYISKE